MNALAEQFFQTADDPDQMPITNESFEKLQALHPSTIVVRFENDEPVSWVVLLPTTRALMEKFLQGTLTEKALLEQTQPLPEYEALYLCAAFTIPSQRRRGYILPLFERALAEIPHRLHAPLFAWIYSAEGRALVEKWNATHTEKILTRSEKT